MKGEHRERQKLSFERKILVYATDGKAKIQTAFEELTLTISISCCLITTSHRT